MRQSYSFLPALIGVLLLLVAAAFTPARAEPSLHDRVARALEASPAAAALPTNASVRIDRMTPVRGDVLEIAITRYDPRTGFFAADLSHGSITKSVSGRARVAVDAAVLTRSVPAGTVLTAGDITLAPIPVGRLPAAPVFHAGDLVGKATRRSVAAGRPLGRDTVGAPYSVRRNDVVTLSFDHSRMTLKAKGTVLDHGGVGDTVRVLPTGGGSVVSGEVIGPRHVSVSGARS